MILYGMMYNTIQYSTVQVRTCAMSAIVMIGTSMDPENGSALKVLSLTLSLSLTFSLSLSLVSVDSGARPLRGSTSTMARRKDDGT